MSLRIYTVDAFETGSPFTGNPAAVCLQTKELSETQLQQIGAEFNLSETAFVRPFEDGGTFESGALFSLRWFTPTQEVSLCGHATLATAHVLFHECGNKNDVIEFETLSGRLKTSRSGNGIALDFPQYNEFEKLESKGFEWDLARVLVGEKPIQDLYYFPKARKLIILMARSFTLKDLKSVQNSRDALLRIHPSGDGVRGIAITMKGDADFHFYSRYFAPWVGITEDPATGAAHCALGPLWGGLLGLDRMRAKQESERGAAFELELKGAERIKLIGRGRTVVAGEIRIGEEEEEIYKY